MGSAIVDKSSSLECETASVAPAACGANKPFCLESLDELLAATREQVGRCDIARMNLLCATGLPGAEVDQLICQCYASIYFDALS
jgi:hypothetical protein